MSAYERQLIAKYHQHELLSAAREARLAKVAQDAGRPHAERVTMTSLTGPLQSILTSARRWVATRTAAAAQAAVVPSGSGRVVLRSTHLR